MSQSDLTKPPAPSAMDHAHVAVKAALQLVPGVGGPAAELFGAVVTPPLSRRRDEWVSEIGRGLLELEATVEGFRAEQLRDSDSFVTTAMHATQVALRNHQREKVEALRNAVLNAALPGAPDDDLQLLFLSLIDVMTPIQLRLLALFDDPEGYFAVRGLSFPGLGTGGLDDVIEAAMPELKDRKELVRQWFKDLFNRGLVTTESITTMMTGNGLRVRRTTDLGAQFLQFITSPLREAKTG